MCGRYDLPRTPSQLAAYFQVQRILEFDPNPDLRPTDLAPIVRLGRDGQRKAVLIVTTQANDLLAEIHDRMPVVLAKANYER